MASIKQTLDDILTLDGAMCAAVGDSRSGMILATSGSGVDIDMAAVGNTDVVRAKLKTMRALGLDDLIEDVQRANLALARRKTQDVDREVDF